MTKPLVEAERTIRLVSHEGETFDTDLLTATTSGYIKEYLQANGDMPEQEQEQLTAVISLPFVRSPILSKILTWAQHHKAEQELSAWDAEFLNMDGTTLLELAMMAYFLDIKGLLEMTAAAVAKGIMMEP
ncbi:S-phase kinase-associated protein 1-like [Drosophila guanche]|uniref:Blast:S-phase kinase-associated protein 1 n=1 Tax=Drosophila guanche TaxID=7266 RepID=A0A3B0JDM6_DROGU|nr:S-phase kinase-associated protein 1-like [Drosophila guanche]SPP78242.1 blast:S-phase kinase-associated protein 1 [Drosophila guanche]